MIVIAPAQLETVRVEAGRGYPDEVCGVLVGHDGGTVRRHVVRSVPVPNARQDERARRYLIDPDTLLGIERTARSEGFEVLGFYHSHPDHPAIPSAFDRDHSWPWYTYLIVSVRNGVAGEARAWRLAEDRSGFQEEEISEEPK